MAVETVSATSEFKAVSALLPGACLLLNGHACVVDDLLVRDVGKHGKAKVHIIGHDVFNGKRIEEIFPNTQTMVECPVLEEKVLQLVDISVDEMEAAWYRVTLLDEYGKEKPPLLVPRDSSAVLFSQGLYNEDDVTKARAMKIAFDAESKKGAEKAQTIAVTVVRCLDKEAVKGYELREQPKLPR